MSVAGIDSNSSFEYSSLQFQMQYEQVQVQQSGQGQSASVSIVEERVEINATEAGISSQSSSGSAASDFKALGRALRSGNLDDAQQAYAALEQDLAGANLSSGSSGASGAGKAAQDLNSLGQALESGDLSGARDAYKSVRQDMRNASSSSHHGHHGHQRMGSAGQDSSEFSSLLVSMLSSQSGAESAAANSPAQSGSTSQSDSSSDSSTGSVSGSLVQDITSLVTALQSGKLSDAQKAYTSVLQDFQNVLAGASSQQTGSSGAGFSLEYASISLNVTTYRADYLSGTCSVDRRFIGILKIEKVLQAQAKEAGAPS